MTNPDDPERQMRMDLYPVDVDTTDSAPPEVDSALSELCSKLRITVDELDKLAEKGSYGDAWRSFGASQSQIDEFYRGSLDSDVTLSDAIDDDVKTLETGASVSIREKASHLLNAGRNLAKASGTEGLIYAIETNHPRVRGKYDLSDVDRLTIKADRCMNIGKKALRNAYGDPEALISVGFDRNDVESDIKDNEEEFVAKNIGPGPDQKRNLAKLRKAQERQIK